jgi:hypothetical protein
MILQYKRLIMDVRYLKFNYIVRLSEAAKVFFFLVILIANITFISYWLYKMIGEVKNFLRTKFEKVYLYVFLCGNKTKLEEEK